jgi:radical SAM protein with 4Fe4S-binding SPASM domain
VYDGGAVDWTSLKIANSRVLREDLADGRDRFRSLPEVVSFQTTDVCNLRCIMCPRNLGPGTHRLEREHLRRIGEDLFPTAWKAILTGAAGEPLGSDFDLILDLCLQFGVKMDVFTNGLLLSRDLYARARPAFDQLNISLDSSDPVLYERIREGARWQRILGVLEEIRAVRAAEPDDVILSFSAVVMRSNLPNLADFVRFAHRMGADVVVFQRLRHEVKRTYEEDPLRNPGRAAATPFVEAALAVAAELGMNIHASEIGISPIEPKPLRPKVPAWISGGAETCWSIAQNFAVMPDGEVYPCCVPNDHVFGNVRWESPREIWNGAVARSLRRAHFSRTGTVFCRGCLYASNLKARGPAVINKAVRLARLAWAGWRNACALRAHRQSQRNGERDHGGAVDA